ncbi:enoyl-CoA hydratase [Saccharopolyspora erythraea NRRL 2338]|uniref:3-hydroxyisobutyryl-CoA hydrolase n=2 Tax=Saccharopolyspora erythraea TaxID=1836 RepID=A4F9Q5_SACEN|nr:enoyl-CoA hydratase/isomerase family protein [Saccharopolyspora erythraea]EQD84572.1 3-hydroxyisobutyryl-CoA hydrolase [Saccharopolyspora erythraea D]PFG94567.1 enoyl-CoA hydratase [Saccharopolyspora erythraea NRRL 2338]QRK91309.1 enoyl-CoA hydratase/isomerase family protein [Saccharopolyspora erythraea]CAM00780.1 putative enoyl-CoA hydratase/isomerase [Saccharopolyspora erythraea NRRL 2338]
MTASPEILVSEQGALGRITLNRPKALNALTLGMVRTMSETLCRWRDAEHIEAVLIDGAGERGLCAGGDIRALYDAAKAGDEEFPATFWAEEYRLNSALARYPKPVVGLMDGITMGGGVGVTAHGSHRVVTERSKIGMPEVGIGFVPDVGGTYLLSRAPGELGTHMALTGAPVTGADAVLAGFADHHVDSSRLGELVEGLAGGAVDQVLGELSQQPPQAPLEAEREWIDAAYSAETVEEILRRLRERPEEAARTAAETIQTKSPTSLKVTLRSLRTGFSSLEQALDQEFRVSMACILIGDLVEGVRATLVDKDRDPKWSPAWLDEVDGALVEKFFEPRGAGELGLDG